MYFCISLITVLGFISLSCGLLIDGGSTTNFLTTKTLVTRNGFDFENHTVITEDGYILEIHRITPISKPSNVTTSEVFFLMHGLLASSSDWCIEDKTNSLPFILAAAGHDVWMGNARGNNYSRRHIKLNPDGLFNKKFWEFSWHEIGVYDLPAMLNYVRNYTGVDKLRYVGHSQGTTALLVLTSMKPQYNAIFKTVHLYAPIAYMGNVSNKFMKSLGAIVGNIKLLQEILGDTEVRPGKLISVVVGNALCTDFSENRKLCENSNFLVSGFTNATVNSSLIPDIMASGPAGSSINQVIHYVQLHVSKRFRQYDHDYFGNIKAYNSSEPPDYRLENISAPVFLYHTALDNLGTPKDVSLLKSDMKTVVGETMIDIEDFDHLAFMYTGDLAAKVHKHLLDDIKNFKSIEK